MTPARPLNSPAERQASACAHRRHTRLCHASEDPRCTATATSGTDYTGYNGTVVLTPANPTATVTVTVLDDNLHEPDEQFQVVLVDVAGPAHLERGNGTFTSTPTRRGLVIIIDDD